MSGKKTKKAQPVKKTSSQASSQHEDAPRKPKTLGMLVLVAGGISTWYWYKPLPPENAQGVYTDWAQAQDEGLWGETDLIRPSLDSLDGEFSDPAKTTDGLVEEPRKLVPVPVYRKDLDDLLANEGVPRLPENPETTIANQLPGVWVNDQENPAFVGSGNSALASGGRTAGSLDWPDQNFNLDKHVSAPKSSVADLRVNGGTAAMENSAIQNSASQDAANRAPELLPVNNGVNSNFNSGSSLGFSRGIVTTESSFSSNQAGFVPPADSWTSPIEQRTLKPATIGDQSLPGTRTPQVIRQPKR